MDHELGELLPVLDVVVKPELELRRDERAHELQRVAASQPVLCLPLELGVEHLAGEDEGNTREDVFRQELHALHGELVRVDEVLHRLEEPVLQPRLVRAA